MTDSDKPKPIEMVEMPENLADMSDEEIEALAAKIYDAWVGGESE